MRTLHIIGNCVIVMSKHYWDEYQNYYLDKRKVMEVLKFYNRSVSVLPVIESEDLQQWKKFKEGKFRFSDIVLHKYDRDKLPEHYKRLYSVFYNKCSKVELPLYMPILVVLKDEEEIKKGIYSFDFKENLIIKYAEINEDEEYKKIINQGIDIEVALFLCLEDSIISYGTKGFIEGILQIGELSGKIKEIYGVAEKKMFTSYISHAHSLGVNIQKLLLIDHIYLDSRWRKV